MAVEIPLMQTAKWGNYTLCEMHNQIEQCYTEITKWRKNIFLLPSGRSGKEFVIEMKSLIDHFINKTPWSALAMNAVMVMIPLLLQKPSKSSKSADHTKYLCKRLTLWKQGELLLILRECKAIQKAMISRKRKPDSDHARKVFVRLIFQGKVSSALRWLNSQCSSSSLEVNDDIINKLKEKHPAAQQS